MIKPKFYRNTDRNERWYSCEICGTDHKTVELMFISGTAEPSIGDVLTGDTSGHSGTVSKVTVWTPSNGQWDGDESATGIIELTSPSGLRSQTADTNPFTMFTLSEEINNTTTAADNVMSCHATILGAGKQYGRFHPESRIIKYRGKKYCREHFTFRFEREWNEEEKIDIKEDNREWI